MSTQGNATETTTAAKMNTTAAALLGTIYAEGLVAGTITDAEYDETAEWIADEQPAGCWDAFDRACEATLAQIDPMPTMAEFYSAS